MFVYRVEEEGEGRVEEGEGRVEVGEGASRN